MHIRKLLYVPCQILSEKISAISAISVVRHRSFLCSMQKLYNLENNLCCKKENNFTVQINRLVSIRG